MVEMRTVVSSNGGSRTMTAERVDHFLESQRHRDLVVNVVERTLELGGRRASQRLRPNDRLVLQQLFDPLGGLVGVKRPFASPIKHPDRVFERVRVCLGKDRRSWLTFEGNKDDKGYRLVVPRDARAFLVRACRPCEVPGAAAFYMAAHGGFGGWEPNLIVLTVQIACPSDRPSVIIPEYDLRVRGSRAVRCALPSDLCWVSARYGYTASEEPPLRISGSAFGALAFRAEKRGPAILTALAHDQEPVSCPVDPSAE